MAEEDGLRHLLYLSTAGRCICPAHIFPCLEATWTDTALDHLSEASHSNEQRVGKVIILIDPNNRRIDSSVFHARHHYRKSTYAYSKYSVKAIYVPSVHEHCIRAQSER